ncbi:CAP domain-containing protein [Sedimentibacter sp.]|uniref:CAP domain-containing protein n=1 Tax=Sedimentibacter sp. TaxID=1960295 RepID=UPI0028A659A0|nr:CAP domain-containing protein [Sedimentibacter sp.]
MKNKVIALSLSAVLALSATPVFAAENCTTVNYNDINGTLNKFISNYAKPNTQYTVKVNGKAVDVNSIDWKTLLNNNTNVVKQPEVQEPAITKPSTEKPVEAPKAQETEKTVQTPAPEASAPSEKDTTVSSSNQSYEQKVVELVNVERQKAGLPALKLDSAISNVARTKSKDMAVNNYFAHQSPTYGSAGDMLTKFGIKWSAWGENIASGQRTPEAVVTAWMNSPGHRANILSSNFGRIGVGYVTNSNGTPYWTQVFAN